MNALGCASVPLETPVASVNRTVERARGQLGRCHAQAWRRGARRDDLVVELVVREGVGVARVVSAPPEADTGLRSCVEAVLSGLVYARHAVEVRVDVPVLSR